MATSDNRMERAKLLRDPFFRLLFVNGLAGIGIGGLFLGGVFLGNIGNLRTLVMTAEDPILPVIMLAVGLMITLGSVVMGSAIMLLGNSGRDGGSPGSKLPVALQKRLEPAPVRVTAGHRRHLPS